MEMHACAHALREVRGWCEERAKMLGLKKRIVKFSRIMILNVNSGNTKSILTESSK